MERLTFVSLHEFQIGVVYFLALTHVGVDANLAGDDDRLPRTIALAHVGFVKLKPQAAYRPRSIAHDHFIESPATTGPGAAGDQDRPCKGLLRSDLQLADRLEIGAVLISTGQQGQGIADRLNP